MKFTVHCCGCLGDEKKKTMNGMSTCYIHFKGDQEHKDTELCTICSKSLLFCHFPRFIFNRDSNRLLMIPKSLS